MEPLNDPEIFAPMKEAFPATMELVSVRMAKSLLKMPEPSSTMGKLPESVELLSEQSPAL